MSKTTTMKKLFLLPLFAVLFLTSCKTNDSDFTSALDFNNYIVNKQSEIVRPMINLMSSEDPAIMKEELVKLQAIIDANITEVKAKKPYKGGEEMKTAYLDLVTFYQETAGNDYREMIDILAEILDGDLSNYGRLEELSVEVGEKEVPFDQKFQHAQEAYAQSHNLRITDNSLQQEIDAIR